MNIESWGEEKLFRFVHASSRQSTAKGLADNVAHCFLQDDSRSTVRIGTFQTVFCRRRRHHHYHIRARQWPSVVVYHAIHSEFIDEGRFIDHETLRLRSS